MTARYWKKINSCWVYRNSWIKIREDKVIRPDGKKGIYAVLEKPAGSFIIPQDKEGNIYLIREYRYPIQKEVWQLPAGVVDGDIPLERAKKELWEETGIKAKRWEKLGGFYVGPGHETTFIYVFWATGLDFSFLKVDHQKGDEAILEIKKVSLPMLKKMIVNGKIICGITLAALNLFFLKKRLAQKEQ